MYSTTGLAVGMAIGVPAAVFIVVFLGFWYRQKMKYKDDIKTHGIDDYDEMNDLDLDHMIDTPRESHAKDFSTDHLITNDHTKNNTTSTSNTNSNESNDELINDSEIELEKDSNKHSKKSSTLFGGGDGVLIRNGSYAIRKESKIMGLRMISKDIDDSKQPKYKVKNDGRFVSNDTLASKNSDKNYKMFYESVIPVFPGTNENGSSSSVPNSSSINQKQNDLVADGSDPLKTPIKHASMMSRNTQSQSNAELYKMLQDDSPFYPKQRASSPMEKPTYSKNSHSNSSSSLAEMMIQSQQQAKNYFHSPQPSTSHSQTTNPYVSPFDTPPATRKLSDVNINNNNNNTNNNADIDSTNHEDEFEEDGIQSTIDQTVTTTTTSAIGTENNHKINGGHYHHDIIEDSIDESFDDSNSAIEHSPSNVHRRLN